MKHQYGYEHKYALINEHECAAIWTYTLRMYVQVYIYMHIYKIGADVYINKPVYIKTYMYNRCSFPSAL